MSLKIGRHFKEETNSSVERKCRRGFLSCSYCKPHKGENHGRCAHYGTQKPKYKKHRRHGRGVRQATANR